MAQVLLPYGTIFAAVQTFTAFFWGGGGVKVSPMIACCCQKPELQSSRTLPLPRPISSSNLLPTIIYLLYNYVCLITYLNQTTHPVFALQINQI